MKYYLNNKTINKTIYPLFPETLGDALVLWLDADDSSTITLNGSSISKWDDKSGNGYHAIQNVADDQPTYPAEQDRVIFNATDRLLTTLPATTGTLVLGTTNGTAAYGVSISSGSYDIGRHGGNYMPDGTAYGYILSNTAMSQTDMDAAIAYLRDQGAGQDYGSVTNFGNYWRNWSELTSFPLINTSSATAFESAWDSCSSLTLFPLIDTSSAVSLQTAWRGCSSLVSFPLINTGSVTDFSAAWIGCSSLTSFPAINTSSGANFFAAWQSCSNLTSFPLLNTVSATNFQQAWQFCSSLTSFPANFFDNCSATNFTNAFRNTNLSQQSIDNILVSIESNNTSHGTFNQSGGSAPSAVGEAAIDALVARGWTVTVTGGYQPPWSPSDLGSALALWLDADDADSVTLNGSSVSQWNDKSGNNRHASQNTATQQPLYLENGLNGKPIVRGDNTDDVLIGDFDVAAANDISVVFVAPSINPQDCIFDFFSPSTGARAANINDIVARQSSSGLVISNAPSVVSLTAPFLAVATHTNSNATAQFDLKLNGGSASFAGYPAGLPTPLFTTELFERYALLDDSTGGNAWAAGVGEYIVAVNLTATNRQKLEGYLAHKWGLTANLPNDHPYKNSAP